MWGPWLKIVDFQDGNSRPLGNRTSTPPSLGHCQSVQDGLLSYLNQWLGFVLSTGCPADIWGPSYWQAATSFGKLCRLVRSHYKEIPELPIRPSLLLCLWGYVIDERIWTRLSILRAEDLYKSVCLTHSGCSIPQCERVFKKERREIICHGSKDL